eukprot:698272-Amphidinium_carterae.1
MANLSSSAGHRLANNTKQNSHLQSTTFEHANTSAQESKVCTSISLVVLYMQGCGYPHLGNLRGMQAHRALSSLVGDPAHTFASFGGHSHVHLTTA